MTLKPRAWQTTVEAWLRRCRGQPAPAVILGGATTGLSFARSLGRRGVPVLMLERLPLLGTFTRFAHSLLLPDADEQPAAWLEVLDYAAARLPAPAVLFPVADAYSLLVARHSAQLCRGYRCIQQEPRLVEQMIDKREQYALAQQAGLPLPATYFPQTRAEASQVAGQVRYPCILKPCVAHLGRKRMAQHKVLLARAPAELLAAFAQGTALGDPFLVQECVPGGDEAVFGYVSLCAADGRELASLTVQKLRQQPPIFGDASLICTVDSPPVAELSRQLLRALNYRGYAGVEFKYDHRDGEYKYIEMNPRSEAFVQVGIGAGIDFPWIGYEYLAAGREPQTPAYQSGVKYVNEELDIQSFLAYRAEGALTTGQWLASLRGARPMVWAWADPLPFLAGLARYAGLMRRITPAVPPNGSVP